MTPIPRSIKSTQDLLRSNNILKTLLTKSRELLRIEAVIGKYVDKNFSVSSFENKQLVLLTSTASQATHIRYRQRSLLKALHREGLDVKQLKIKIQPVLVKEIPPTIERHLSEENAKHLSSIAEHIDHLPLKQALIELSRNTD